MSRVVAEQEKKIPVAREVDVVVAGAGVSGLFAALGAAKEGASVLLVDRFGNPGGNMGGPGLIMFGGLVGARVEKPQENEWIRFVSSLKADFTERAKRYLGEEPREYPVIAHVISQVAFEMMREFGVELMLSAYAADPVMDGNKARGLFVETKSGRVAVAAKVIIDATGDASIAERAGAPVVHYEPVVDMDCPSIGEKYARPEYTYWNDGAIMYIATGADMDRYDEWRWRVKESEWGPGDAEWFHAHFEEQWSHGQKALIPKLREYEERGAPILQRDIRPRFHTNFLVDRWVQIAPGVITGVCNVMGEFDTGDWKDISLAEEHARTHAFDAMRFMKDNIPGFERVEIIGTAAFLGARGGPRIEGDYVLTVKEGFQGLRHPETMYVSGEQIRRGAQPPGHDVPYGMIVPRKVDGILVAARGASWIRRGHDPNFRCRGQMMNFGHAVGLAAAMAVADGVQPRDLDVKKLQKALLAEGFDLGHTERLVERGLA